VDVAMEDISKMCSEILLKIGSLHFYDRVPYQFASGVLSPVYVDCRKIISYPNERRKIIEWASYIVKEKIGIQNIDKIAGGETAGIPFAAWLSEKLDIPMIYIRKAPKGYGRLAQIEGEIEKGDKVLLFEDLIFDSSSKINFLKGVLNAGGMMKHVLVIFEYGLPNAREKLKEHRLMLHSLVSWDALLPLAYENGHFSNEECKQVRMFLKDPQDFTKNIRLKDMNSSKIGGYKE
jgi:orotate phosphoribosyltransferase